MCQSVCYYISFFFFLIIFTSSCTKKTDQSYADLSKADKLLEYHSDSALRILQSIPQNEILKGEPQAYYALLMTQALINNDLPIHTDSLITIAVSYYYSKANTSTILARSMFLHGKVLFNIDRDEDALVSFLSAKTIYTRMHEYKMLAQISEAVGMINRKQELYNEAIVNFKYALTIYKQQNDSNSIINANINIARIYLLKSEWKTSTLYYTEALHLASNTNYISKNAILHELGILQRIQKNYSKAEQYFLTAYNTETDPNNKYKECLSLGYLYLQINQKEKAREYLMLSTKSTIIDTKIDGFTCLYYLEKRERNYEKAIEYRAIADSLTNVASKDDSHELVADLQSKYESEKLKNDNLQTKIRYINYLLWGMVALLAVAFRLSYYYYKNKNNKRRIAEIESQISYNNEEILQYQNEIEDITESKDLVMQKNLMLEESRNKVGELNGKIMLLATQNKLLTKKIQDLGSELVDEVYSESYLPAFRLLLALKEGSVRGKLSNDDRQRLFDLFDFIFGMYVTRLLERNPLLTKHNLEICCFLKFGMSNNELSNIFHTTSESVTRAKGRLKVRLGLLPEDDLDEFIKYF